MKTIFSPCRKYRFTLWREWGDLRKQTSMDLWPEKWAENRWGEYVQFIGLNPSTADETLDDPTIRRCIRFTKSWGFGAYCMTNIFAFRATDPNVMKAQEFPKERPGLGLWQNDGLISAMARGAGMVIAAWGKHGSHQGRGKEVLEMLMREVPEKTYALGFNSDGSPKHPLYLAASTQPVLIRKL